MRNNRTLYLNLIIILLYWLVLQDFILALIYNVIKSSIITNILFYSKDVIFICLTVYAVFKFKIKTVLIYDFLLLFLLIFISACYSLFFYNISIMQLLQNIRDVILLIGFIIIGTCISKKDFFEFFIVKRYFNFLIFCAVFGIAEYLLDKIIGTKSFWYNIVGITEYYVDIKGQGGRLVDGLPGNFYGDYGNGYFSSKRLVGFWMGPLTAAYVLLIPLIYYSVQFFMYDKMNNVCALKLIVLFIAVLLTHTRVIIFLYLAFFTIVFIYFLRRHTRYFGLICILLLGLALIIAILNIDRIYKLIYDGSTLGHLQAFFGALYEINFSIIGMGFGAFGINGSTSTESMYLTIWGNLGLLGLVAYIFPLYVCYNKLRKNKNNNAFNETILYALVCFFITGFISEQLSAYTTMAPFYILLGVSFSKINEAARLNSNLGIKTM